MDAVADVLKKIPEQDLERIKTRMVRNLIEKKVFHNMRFRGKHLIAIDGTGISTFHHKHCDQCTHTTSKKGKKTYYHKVLEAKLVTLNGFNVSICTVFIDNKDQNSGEYSKQGSEMRAFVELARKLKRDFPRMPICLCADGLYPNKTFFEACQKNGWEYIVTLKEGSLKGFWKKIRFVNRDCRKLETKEGGTLCQQNIQWINKTEHNDVVHDWIQCRETKITKSGKEKKNKFVHLTNIEVDYENSAEVSRSGRLRWKIENEGFDIQKNHGYNMQHKFCRKSYLGLKNFYQCCQIAHMINQLIELSKIGKEIFRGKTTVNFVWEQVRAFMSFCYVSIHELHFIENHRFQIQYPFEKG